MSPLFTLAGREVGRLTGSTRGLLTLLAFALLWALVFLYVILPAAGWLENPEIGSLAGMMLERAGLERMESFGSPELALYWFIAPWLLPLFAISLAADQIASDKARGTLRFLVLRTSRSSVLLGRFLGQCMVMLLVVITTLGSVLVAVALNSPQQWPRAAALILPVITNEFLVLLPYVALMSLMSVLARSARQATLFTIVAWIAVSLLSGWVQARYGPVPWLDWVLPGSQISSLVRLPVSDALSLAPVPLLHCMVLLGLAWYAMRRIDL